MKLPLKNLYFLVFPLVVVFVLTGLWYMGEAVPIGTGYTAKYLCSQVFISDRQPQEVFDTDIAPVNILTKVIDYKIDRDNKIVTAKAFGTIESSAVYREGCGCTLAVDTSISELKAQAPQKKFNIEVSDYRRWPRGTVGPEDPATFGIDANKLKKAIDNAFEEPGPGKLRRTRAVVVVYKGNLVAERYADGYSKDTPILGWSMTKSVTNALVGIMVKKGKLDIYKPAPVPEWKNPDDPRSLITIDHLLRMSSGLKFEEKYAPLYDATDLLYGSHDTGAFAASKKLEAKPDEKWSYSTGTTNIISRILKNSAGSTLDDYYQFVNKELFSRLKMKSAVIEPDSSGVFVGSSYMFATPRDWARFGLLYLNDGKVNNKAILPPGWVKYSTSPTAKSPLGKYGAQFWLNAGEPGNPENRRWKSLPQDAYFASGYQHQNVGIIPSKKLVVVRMGLTLKKKAWNLEKFMFSIIESLPE